MTTDNNKLLIEIGTEELPSNDLSSLSKILLINLKILYKKYNIKFKNIKNFITIRRISFIIEMDEFKEEYIKTIIEKLLKDTKFKINMRWEDNKETFIRPIIWYVLMYNSNLIKHKIFNIESNIFTESHRIKKKYIKVTAQTYEKDLKIVNVIVDQKKRLKIIKENLIKILIIKKIKLILNKEELTKISNSIEFPKIIVCKFNKLFLSLPEKIIINNLLEKNCIPIIKKNIINKFIIIADTYIKNQKKIKNGYEQCINMKLSESDFFYKQNYNFIEKNKLKNLKNIIFHEKIGNLYNKIFRMTFILKNLNVNEKIKIIKTIILSKLDIQTKIVSEMPNLKGIISAHNLKINKDISKILYEYNKIFNNEIPKSKIAAIITILDNIDNIVGFFLIGEKAKNKKDPFNLRRDAIIIIKTIITNKLNINLNNLIKFSLMSYNSLINKNINKEVIDFIFDRLNFYKKNNLLKKINTHNIYIKQLISTAYYKFSMYNVNNEIKILIKKINKIKNKNLIKNKNKYNRNIDININKIFLIKSFMKFLKITRILYKNNLFFEYIKTILTLKIQINNFLIKFLF
ncbi:MAG TPA: glycine--tRNA ligase subunit beta [Candidatus Azoamicus sp.]